MDGIIVVNKEKGMTSHDVVNKIRRIFNTKRVGHLGTLDPLATGVLVVCINEATKLVQFLQEHDKKYIARVCLGKATDTYDLEGNITSEKKVFNVDAKLLDETIASFLGESSQIPPIYSSIKVNGKKLYEYAREQKEVEILPKTIKIHQIRRISQLEYKNNACYFDLELEVSKGTYIRSICYDLGKKLSLPSMMVDLQRISSDIFNLENAYKLEQIEKGEYVMYSMLEGLNNFAKISDEELIKKAKCGMKISLKTIFDHLQANPQKVVIYEKKDLVAIYQLSDNGLYYKAARVWN